MNYKAIGRRLARLEQDARVRQKTWVNSLSDAELDALCKDTPADKQAAFDAMTDDDLERLASGRMPEAEWRRRLQDANRDLNPT
jgi:hypothetical protein